jgi:hypothetical protein
VVVGDDVPFLVDDHPGTQALLETLPHSRPDFTKQLLDGIGAQLFLDDARRIMLTTAGAARSTASA